MTDVQQPALGVSFTVDAPGGRNLVFQTHVPQDATAAQLNVMMDKLCTSADRTVARYTLPLLLDALEVEKLQLDRITDDLKRIDGMHANSAMVQNKTRRVPFQLSEKDQQQRVQVELQIKQFRERVAKVERQIAECKAKINGADQRANS